jgi:hypothetical protein
MRSFRRIFVTFSVATAVACVTVAWPASRAFAARPEMTLQLGVGGQDVPEAAYAAVRGAIGLRKSFADGYRVIGWLGYGHAIPAVPELEARGWDLDAGAGLELETCSASGRACLGLRAGVAAQRLSYLTDQDVVDRSHVAWAIAPVIAPYASLGQVALLVDVRPAFVVAHAYDAMASADDDGRVRESVHVQLAVAF